MAVCQSDAGAWCMHMSLYASYSPVAMRFARSVAAGRINVRYIISMKDVPVFTLLFVYF